MISIAGIRCATVYVSATPVTIFDTARGIALHFCGQEKPRLFDNYLRKVVLKGNPMKINDSSPVLKPHIAPGKVADNAVQGQAASQSSTELTQVSLSSTAELENLIAQSADVRESLVADIKLRLAAGEFASDQAAYNTAESILNL